MCVSVSSIMLHPLIKSLQSVLKQDTAECISLNKHFATAGYQLDNNFEPPSVNKPENRKPDMVLQTRACMPLQ